MDLRWNDTLFGQTGKMLGQGAIAKTKDSKGVKDLKKEENPEKRDSSSGIIHTGPAFDHRNPAGGSIAVGHGPEQFAGVEKNNVDSIIERARRAAAEKTAKEIGAKAKPDQCDS